MEFLTTYGWAILAAIVAIAVLAYFGIFNPGKISGDRIIISFPFYAVASQIIVISTPEVNFEISNKLTSSVTINNAIITGSGPSEGVDCAITAPILDLQPDEITLINAPCTGTLSTGDTYIGEIDIIYTKSGTSLSQNVGGKLKAVVQ